MKVLIETTDAQPSGRVVREDGAELPVKVKRLAIDLEPNVPPAAYLELVDIKVRTFADPRFMIQIGAELVEVDEIRAADGRTFTKDALLGGDQ